MMARYIFIAARDHSDLYGYLQRQFAQDDEVQVLSDRRHEERRRQVKSHAPDRRRRERRSGRGKDHGLDHHGFLVVRQTAQISQGFAIQWRPPGWELAGPEEAAPETPKPPAEAYTTETRKRISAWITESLRMLGLVSKLFAEQGHLTARAEMAERKCERLEEEMRNTRSENEHFRRERRQLADTLKNLARQMVESSGERS